MLSQLPGLSFMETRLRVPYCNIVHVRLRGAIEYGGLPFITQVYIVAQCGLVIVKVLSEYSCCFNKVFKAFRNAPSDFRPSWLFRIYSVMNVRSSVKTEINIWFYEKD